MDLKTVRVSIPDGANVILGQTHFIKTAEDLYEILAGSSPHIKFGVAFTEASGPCLIRLEGNDPDLTQAAVETVQNIGAGHVFAIFIRDAFPINVLNSVKMCSEVCRIYCATANPARTSRRWCQPIELNRSRCHFPNAGCGTCSKSMRICPLTTSRQPFESKAI